MALFIASLNSGSNGNCYYVGNSQDAVLIDAGLSCRDTEKRLLQAALPIDRVRAIFVSHEHTDHIKGLPGLANKYNLPVYITDGTLQHGPHLIRKLSRPFIADEPVIVGSLQVIPFTKRHDAADPHSFMVGHEGINAGVFTDIGSTCEKVIHYFGQCHAAFLEANYDDAMLENGIYPLVLKNRIRGDRGHLSNSQALELFIRYRPAFMTHLLLSHLSKENNDPELVRRLFLTHAGNVEIDIASRYAPSAVYAIDQRFKKAPVILRPQQMKLFHD